MPVTRFLLGALSSTATLLAAACSAPAELSPRPQYVVMVDTDAPLVSELRAHPEISPDAAVDTLRVDVLSGARVQEVREFVISDASQWPLSFGVQAGATAERTLRLRLRLFRGSFARSELTGAYRGLEPPAAVAIEQLVDLSLNAVGVIPVEVLMSLACFGVPSSFAEPARTCLGASRQSVLVREVSAAHSAAKAGDDASAGAWTAVESQCSASAGQGERCIPGGFSILGDQRVELEGLTELAWVPLRPVLLSPFFLDKHEYTVGRLRRLLTRARNAGLSPSKAPASEVYGDVACTWLGPTHATNDALPLNCVDWALASAICKAEGGSLPTEAQWEHAARGRGERRLYPWGDVAPTCCTAALGRYGRGAPCAGYGPEVPRSHDTSAACSGRGDVSRDGVFDLAGNVAEAVLDSGAPYSDECWSAAGVPVDPLCERESVVRVLRGGNWFSDLDGGFAPVRHKYATSPRNGFRCAYKDVTP